MVAQRQELMVLPINSISMWEEKDSLKEIQLMFAPELSAMEFKLFIALGKATGLNPYLKEIWAVKYKNSPAQIFIGRDGYRKGAQRQPSYDYHLADAVYENDEFDVENGKVKHKYSLKNRGNLLGAYCVVKRKGSSEANFVFVTLEEYDKKQSTWKDLKPTMIKKVAEAQGLRSCYQEVFAGTYHEYEQFEQIEVVETPKGKGMNALEKALNIEPEIMEEKKEEVYLVESLFSKMSQLIIKNNVPEKSLEKWRKQFSVSTLEDISVEGMEAIIKHLTKEKK